MTCLQNIRRLLHNELTPALWSQLVQALAAWPESQSLDVAIDYINAHLDPHPFWDRLRVMPTPWLTSPGNPRTRIVRHLDCRVLSAVTDAGLEAVALKDITTLTADFPNVERFHELSPLIQTELNELCLTNLHEDVALQLATAPVICEHLLIRNCTDAPLEVLLAHSTWLTSVKALSLRLRTMTQCFGLSSTQFEGIKRRLNPSLKLSCDGSSLNAMAWASYRLIGALLRREPALSWREADLEPLISNLQAHDTDAVSCLELSCLRGDLRAMFHSLPRLKALRLTGSLRGSDLYNFESVAPTQLTRLDLRHCEIAPELLRQCLLLPCFSELTHLYLNNIDPLSVVISESIQVHCDFRTHRQAIAAALTTNISQTRLPVPIFDVVSPHHRLEGYREPQEAISSVFSLVKSSLEQMRPALKLRCLESHDFLQPLIDSPLLSQFESLDIDNSYADAASIVRLLASPFCRLKSLSLVGVELSLGDMLSQPGATYLEHLTIDGDLTVPEAERLTSLSRLNKLALNGVTNQDAISVVMSRPWLSLNLSRCAFPEAPLTFLGHRLGWRWSNLQDQELRCLIDAVSPDTLRDLSLVGNDFSPDAVDALLGCPIMANLVCLNLGGAPVGDHGLSRLIAQDLSKLRALGLNSTHLTTRGVRRLLQASGLEHLSALSLGFTPLDVELLRGFQDKRWSSLRWVALPGTELDDAGLTQLLKASCISTLTTLDLFGSKVTDRGLEALASHDTVSALKVLFLCECPNISWGGLRALGASSNLFALEDLFARSEALYKSAVGQRWPNSELKLEVKPQLGNLLTGHHVNSVIWEHGCAVARGAEASDVRRMLPSRR